LILRFTFSRNLFGWHPFSESDQINHSIMNKNLVINFLLILAGLVAPLQRLHAQAATPAIVSVDKTSFAEVTSQLDPGGNFYLYLGTAQWLERLSKRTEGWRQKVETMPNLKAEDRANLDKAFDLLSSVITDSGVENISGVGMSSIEIEKGLYRNKLLLHHYPGKGDGFLWKLCGPVKIPEGAGFSGLAARAIQAEDAAGLGSNHPFPRRRIRFGRHAR
jgi:hypothetical protein